MRDFQRSLRVHPVVKRRSRLIACTGPVDAAYKAIDALVRVPVTLEDYSMSSVTEGITALAVTRVIVRPATELTESTVTTAQVRVLSASACNSTSHISILRRSKPCTVPSADRLPLRVQGRTTKRSFAASAAHEDVVVGSARAYVNALNKLMDWMKSQQIAEPAHQAVTV